MVSGVEDFSALPQDQALGAGAALIGSGDDVFMVVAGGLARQAAFPVLEDGAVVAMVCSLAFFDAVDCRLQVDGALIDDPSVLVLERDLRDVCWPRLVGLFRWGWGLRFGLWGLGAFGGGDFNLAGCRCGLRMRLGCHRFGVSLRRSDDGGGV